MHISDVGCEVFFDSDDNSRTSVDSASSYFSVDEDHEFKLRIFNPESWLGDMMSVQERRQNFWSTMGFDDFSSQSHLSFSPEEPSGDSLPDHIQIRRLPEGNGASLDTFSALDAGRRGDSPYCIRDLDNGKVFIIHDYGDNGLPSMLKELGSDKLLTYQEFEESLGLSCSVNKLMDIDVSPSGEKECEDFSAGRKLRNWWRRLFNKRHVVGVCKHDVSIKSSQLSRTIRSKILRHRKRCRELTALFIEQEIRAHKGSIRTMKFCPSGWYLASGGEDCIVRIWQIMEAENPCKCLVENGSGNIFGKARSSSLIGMKGCNCASIVFPKKTFKILEKPLRELSGHTGEILDLSWSSSEFLLTSSMDKTVRLWKASCDGCLKVFGHNDYVTCIQFNPVDERYFISGSIDGKVRIWAVLENHVVDWADIRDIVTAVCYRPDGKGFVVGCINGNCRFYDYLGNNMHLYMQFSIEGKQKYAGKRVTGLQFSPDDAQQIMITSADSRVRIFDGFGVVHKFIGLGKTKTDASASFTCNGGHIISVGEDSNVYIWNYDSLRKPTPGRGVKVKSIRSFQLFFSERVSVAVAWPNTNLKVAASRINSLHHPTKPMKIWTPSTSSWLSRVVPLERLPLSSAQSFSQLDIWSMGFVTASSDGFIRSFHNYGLPLRS